MCEANGSKIAKLISREGGYNGSSIHVVSGRLYMDTIMVEIIFLISEGRYNQLLMPGDTE
jgi:hypothetical protein